MLQQSFKKCFSSRFMGTVMTLDMLKRSLPKIQKKRDARGHIGFLRSNFKPTFLFHQNIIILQCRDTQNIGKNY